MMCIERAKDPAKDYLHKITPLKGQPENSSKKERKERKKRKKKPAEGYERGNRSGAL